MAAQGVSATAIHLPQAEGQVECLAKMKTKQSLQLFSKP